MVMVMVASCGKQVVEVGVEEADGEFNALPVRRQIP
jgi:hypothetical protein